MIKQITAFSIAFVLAIACSTPKKEDRDSLSNDATASWKEMDDFHMIMAEAFHPFKDSANLQPVKTRYSKLEASADKWINSAMPSKVDNEEVKLKLQQLNTEVKVLAEKTRTGTDEEIALSLTKLHDIFHEIQEIWYSGESKEHHHHE